MVHTIPQGHIGLGDAFQRLLAAWGANELARAIEAASDAGDVGLQRDCWQRYDAAVSRVEQTMRAALVSGELCALVENEYGRIGEPCERSDWGKMSLGQFGISNVPERLINPGPNTSGRPVFLEISAFQVWMSARKHEVDPFHTGAPGKPSAITLVKGEHQRRLDARSALKRVSHEAFDLKRWLNQNYPSAPNTTPKTIENAIRDAHRQNIGKGGTP